MNGFSSTTLENGLRVIHKELKGTDIITSNIVYRVGSCDELPGETGLAHMLEHMLFKPTKKDLKAKIDSGAMQFEREVGCVLNANTWKTRTAYFFCYPKQYLNRALAIESDRMNNVVLSDKEFQPERTNVLSEFDMYNGDPTFALSVDMVSAAFQSNPYGHETIGFREDIEDYTVEKLERFYRLYYAPNNATLTIVGDISKADALLAAKKHFGKLKNPAKAIERLKAREPKQGGLRRININRPSNTNILAIGFKHEGFPSKDWHTAAAAIDVLIDGSDSLLHKALIDTGIAANLSCGLEPTDGENLGILFITLTKGHKHADVEKQVLEIIDSLKAEQIKPKLASLIAQSITEEKCSRSSSLGITRELTEYIAAGDWQAYFNTEKTLKSITPKNVKDFLDTAFAADQLVIGNFNGLA